MSTIRSIFVLPLLASAFLAPVAMAGGPPEEPPVRMAHKTKKLRKAHHCAPTVCAVPQVPVITVGPVCGPDFADQWYDQARLAWVGPTRCFPFQPNGFYPMPNFRSIVRVAPGTYPEEIIGDGGGK